MGLSWFPNRCAFNECHDACTRCGETGIHSLDWGCPLKSPWNRRARLLGKIGLGAVAALLLAALAACGTLESASQDHLDVNGLLRLERGPGGCVQRRYNADRGWYWGLGSCRMGLRDQ